MNMPNSNEQECRHPSTKHKKPSRHKMALVTFFSIWTLVHIAMNYIHPIIPGPDFIREMLVVALIVVLMTYIVMPILMKQFYEWLHE